MLDLAERGARRGYGRGVGVPDRIQELQERIRALEQDLSGARQELAALRGSAEVTEVDAPAVTGLDPSPERRAVRERLSSLDAAREPFVLIAIDKVAGEGIDLPSLNTLFLAVPVSFKGRIIQQIGRVTRGSGAPDLPTVHDFRDVAVPVLERMHNRRRRVVAKEGFSISTERG